ncbi:ATPase (plasmid) [Bacillus thuringiensis LM1212]|uniref:Rpn family recombination-promoting nuclease/putative transposase n=1 Tax=Bacillus cereus group TaxID=86661 RepID=UPI000402CC76|nr:MULTISPECIES: Rpn family recombination-promoting nuclease/putative transposase [Bacillus cereus group]AXY11467.1 ATPase [Bacillus thuringiensis LM1212]AXY11479.1 ATPase [Bacillus thuringiensis LM1212]QDF27242.1 Rpn family recombination-promoting nuclease/putative transposase [Bacillus tropicus]QDF27397.1 Rpn family recombination-promoting nuclease/putative transposase [Bacillus tropicus]QUG99226.1 Rpn family recombination-promoting nuclease/putative transposase [Bacillus tropicus]
MNNRVNLRIDFAFKQLFGTKGNEEILMGFLNAVLQRTLSSPITSLTLEDPHLHKEYKEDKLSIMDVRAALETGELVNIEIQIANKHDIQKRSLYYWSKLYASHMQEGMAYSELQKGITINVLDFVLYPNQEHFQTTGVLWDVEKELRICEDIEIHSIELPKLIAQWRDAQVNPWHDALVRWLLLLAANEDQNLTDILEAIALEQDETLQKAIQKWDNMSHNQQFRREYEAREKVLLDEKAAVAHAEKKGIEKGRKEGIEQGKIQLIRGMHNNGVSIEDISKFTKISLENIRRFLQGE